MTEQSRVISLSVGTLLIVGVLGSIQFEIAKQLDRIADAADMNMCLEAMKIGIDPMTLPKPCKALRTQVEGEPT
ncbi:hypothetical protein [Novosphingobium resinovorum]|uniref:hypothetical protein n=1 Tax=Novosphingobium resinovorum TaxID=158500 RepID=UPI002ED0C774|nr:hypothetical protein [Novosphingobium resinovorum]